jgi:hypothetical protein
LIKEERVMNAQTSSTARTSEFSESAMAWLRADINQQKCNIDRWKSFGAIKDIQRQHEREPVNPEWYAAYANELNYKRDELRRLQGLLHKMQRAAAVEGSAKRDEFRDTLLAVLRTRHDEASWEKAKVDARRLMAMMKESEVSHG